MRYISSGLKVDPDERISPLLVVEGSPDAKAQFEIISHFGNFEIEVAENIYTYEPIDGAVIEKNEGTKFVIMTSVDLPLEVLNAFLSALVYTVRAG